MNRSEFAGKYLTQYEDTDITITDLAEFNGGVIFDLSDGTHWLSDDNGTYQVTESLTDVEIGWSDTWGWIIVNENGTVSQIGWCD